MSAATSTAWTTAPLATQKHCPHPRSQRVKEEITTDEALTVETAAEKVPEVVETVTDKAPSPPILSSSVKLLSKREKQEENGLKKSVTINPMVEEREILVKGKSMLCL